MSSASGKLRLRAIIGDFVFDDVVAFDSTFALNSIPMASVTVAVGRSVDDDSLATIHQAADGLKPRMEARVYLRSFQVTEFEADFGVPQSEVLVFEGVLVGAGWVRTTGGARFRLNLLHWLSHINYASAASATSHPGNPANFIYPGVYTTMDPTGQTAAASRASWVPSINFDAISAAGLSDIWGNVLHKWMETVSKMDPFDVAINGGQGGGDPKVLDAIDRMKPGGDGVPLQLVSGSYNASQIASGITQALTNETFGNWINTTLWGKLIGEWAPAYWFCVVPRVEDALVVPYVGSLSGEPWAVIGGEDWASENLNVQMSQILKGVGITHPTISATGLDLGQGTTPIDRGGLAGWFEPAGQEAGMVMLKRPPKWLTDTLQAPQHSFDAEAIGDDQTTNTAVDEEGTGEDSTGPDPKEADSAYKFLLNKFAEQWYVVENLKARMGEVGGKLRFDIAPGSTVRVNAKGGVGIPNQSQLSQDVYGTVLQVTTSINAESQQAGTAFSIDHLRTEGENNTPGFAISGPPLYQQAWRGAKLIPSAPGPETS